MTMTTRTEAALNPSPLDHESSRRRCRRPSNPPLLRHDSAFDALAGVSIDVPVGEFTAVTGHVRLGQVDGRCTSSF
jgi:hypothetical protein